MQPEQLSFKKGDVIIVTQERKSGWWKGKLNGKEGKFPSNYTKPFEETSKQEESATNEEKQEEEREEHQQEEHQQEEEVKQGEQGEHKETQKSEFASLSEALNEVNVNPSAYEETPPAYGEVPPSYHEALEVLTELEDEKEDGLMVVTDGEEPPSYVSALETLTESEAFELADE